MGIGNNAFGHGGRADTTLPVPQQEPSLSGGFQTDPVSEANDS